MTETILASEKISQAKKKVSTIFVGGGTPSMSDMVLFDKWLILLKEYFEILPDIEFSFETNPESVTLEKLQILKEAGVTRPVFGIQSFNLKLLKLLNRRHNPYHSQRAVYYSNALGYRNFGVDLIFGLPGQTSRMLSDDIDQIIDLAPPHISYYQLTVEEGTPLAEMVRAEKVKMPDQELSLALYRGGCQRFSEAGYKRYEVSSFALPGYECRHNMGYWDGSQYLGLGPSAHSFINNQRFANTADLGAYLRSLETNTLPRIIDESGDKERMTEAILLGLRTSDGVSREQFLKRFGIDFGQVINKRQYQMLLESGHICDEANYLRLSDKGIYVLDEIVRRLLE